jgi:zinc transporter ZupT
MKQTLSVPVIIGVVAVVFAVVAFFFIKSATTQQHTPRPDPAMFGVKRKAPTAQ